MKLVLDDYVEGLGFGRLEVEGEEGGEGRLADGGLLGRFWI